MWCLQRLLQDRDGVLLGRSRRVKSRSSSACTNVLTPDRIPEFCIPPRLETSLPQAAARDAWDLGDQKLDHGAGRTDWDPRSQAALSLPHLPRARTAYGFCALLESPHTRRKESLFLGDPGAPVPRPRAHTCPAPAPRAPPPAAPAALPAGAPPPRARRLLSAPDGLLGRALRARSRRRRARARSAAGADGDEDDERAAAPAPPAGPRPERLQAEGTVALGRAGGALRLAAEYCPARGRLRLRLLRAEGPAAALEPRAVGCRLSLVLRPPGSAREQRSAVLGRSRGAAFDQDLCFDGLTEEQLRRLAVRVQAENKGRGLERRRALGQGELPLGSLLLL